jgi:hypothetical protein
MIVKKTKFGIQFKGFAVAQLMVIVKHAMPRVPGMLNKISAVIKQILHVKLA